MKHFLLTCLVIITCGLCRLTHTQDEEPDKSVKTLAAVLTAKFDFVSGNIPIQAISLEHVQLPETLFSPSVYTMISEDLYKNGNKYSFLLALSLENNTLTICAYKLNTSRLDHQSDAANPFPDSLLATLTRADIIDVNCTVTYQASHDNNYISNHARCNGAEETEFIVNCTHLVSKRLKDGPFFVFARNHSNVIPPEWTLDQQPCSV